MKKALPIVLAFAVGLAVGVLWTKSAAKIGESSNAVELAETQGLEGKDEVPACDAGETCPSEDPPPEEEAAVPPPTVETIVDNSPPPEPEVLAAHAARQARRRAAREAAENERHDFLSSLNLDLLTAEQRKVHELYVEANKTRNTLRREISALRREGKEVPAELLSRLADAESVLRADREREQGALREAAARATGLDEPAVRQLMTDLMSIDQAFAR